MYACMQVMMQVERHALQLLHFAFIPYRVRGSLKFWEGFGTLLGPSWDHLGFDFRTSKKHPISMSKRLAKHVPKKFPKMLQKSAKMVPRGSQEASKKRSKVDFNLKSWTNWVQKAAREACWKQRQKTLPKNHQKKTCLSKWTGSPLNFRTNVKT